MDIQERNGLQEIIDKALEEMRADNGGVIDLEALNLAEFSRRTGLSRSKARTIKANGFKVLDAYRHVIEGYLDEDELSWRKQRHTARRIWRRLRDEHGVTCSESTVRHYVHDLKAQRKSVSESYLDLVWNPGEAQADFGEADFMVVGAKRRMSFFVLSFPFSPWAFCASPTIWLWAVSRLVTASSTLLAMRASRLILLTTA